MMMLHIFPFVAAVDVADDLARLGFHIKLDRSAAALTLLAVARGDGAESGAGFSLGFHVLLKHRPTKEERGLLSHHWLRLRKLLRNP